MDPTWWKTLREYAEALIVALLLALFIRGFVVQAFKIPSESMLDTLLVGDHLLVTKFTYGVRLPVINTKVLEINEPQRGDIVVFRFPKDPKVDYIKRIIGLPGDKIVYENKKLTVNGVPAKQVSLGRYEGVGQGRDMTGAEHLLEDLAGVEHSILIRDGALSAEGVYVVPEHSYFVMGDNRDNSNDGRYWGMVPEDNLVGKAFFIWMSWDWQYKGVSFERIGTVLK